jgi:hypothetical protein
MGEVISIEKPFDKAIELIREKQELTREYIKDLEKIQDEQAVTLALLVADGFPQNAEMTREMEALKKDIEWCKDTLERSEQLVGKLMQRKARLSGEKTFEIKIR